MSAAAQKAVAAYWNDDFTPLQAAGKAIIQELREDEASPDADLYRRIISSGSGSHLYFRSPGILMHQTSIPLPPFLAEKSQTTKISSLMGLLPEAGLSWMTIDDVLYLWRSDGASSASMDDLCSFVTPSGQCVASVGLVKPRKGKRTLCNAMLLFTMTIGVAILRECAQLERQSSMLLLSRFLT